MRELVRSRVAQGIATTPFPAQAPEFPERFRGRPVLECAGCAGRCLDHASRQAVPSALLRERPDGGIELDLGACLFSPEEAAGRPGCGIRFTHDHRLAAGSRGGLVVASEESRDHESEAAGLAAALDERMRRLLGRSLRLRSVVAGSCNGCEAELVAASNVVFDMARFGIQFVASPRHADGILITGPVNTNMREALLATYDAVPDPRVVIAVGACAASGGPFRGSPEVVGIPPEIPVDLWIAGCPPHPITILDGLLRMLGRIGAGERPSPGSSRR